MLETASSPRENHTCVRFPSPSSSPKTGAPSPLGVRICVGRSASSGSPPAAGVNVTSSGSLLAVNHGNPLRSSSSAATPIRLSPSTPCLPKFGSLTRSPAWTSRDSEDRLHRSDFLKYAQSKFVRHSMSITHRFHERSNGLVSPRTQNHAKVSALLCDLRFCLDESLSRTLIGFQQPCVLSRTPCPPS